MSAYSLILNPKVEFTKISPFQIIESTVTYLSLIRDSILLEKLNIKEYMSDSFTNYNYVGNTKVSVSIKKPMPYANKCTLREIFLAEILKSFSVF